MNHFRMELKAIQPPRRVSHGRHRAILRAGQCLEASRQTVDPVTVTHPDRKRLEIGDWRPVLSEVEGLEISKQRHFGMHQFDFCWAVLAFGGRIHLTAQVVGQQLHTVADAQHRQSALQYVTGQVRCVGCVDAGRSAAQDEAHWAQPGHLLGRRVMGYQLTVNFRLTHAAGDKLAILGTKVKDDNGFALYFPLRLVTHSSIWVQRTLL